ncbi:MAG: glycosyltransferase family 4 protein [Sulfurimonas sp.]
MRILTVTNYYPPHFIGGYEIACQETMDFLKEQGHEVVVVTSDYHKSDITEDGILRNMRLIQYNKTSRVQKEVDEYHNYKTVRDAIKTTKPDLVYYWSLRGIGLSVIEASQKQNILKVFEIGDFWMYGYMQKSSLLKQKIKSFLPFLNKKNILITPTICVSEWVAKEMKNVYKSDTTYVYPNATLVPKKKISDNTDIKFIFAGRIDEEKGLDLAIEALNKFATLHPTCSFSFDIYGSGEQAYMDKCQALAKPIDSMVSFKGKVQLKEEIYSNASVLLMPTRMREPFGLVLIEAMAHGCAVIATNAYGPAEIIDHGENGLLFELQNTDDLLTQIESVYFDTQYLNRLQENGYKHVLKNYSIPKVKSEVETLLKKISGVE